ncbi:DUF2971 domain-containing protein [Mesobacillus stamsii]|uniref:DUF2971 domain-containing protein n=1 Tax=Mesobacillus stamsii TaxID=225347 RepID=A0ABU0G0F5_9BACI|nr:DUF2971 domain-containing protein [Mesobacillus stamsii]MDQ0415671.1 hypothetical protein [Mesobacillus stamsii]
MHTLDYIISKAAREDLKHLMGSSTSAEQRRLLDVINLPTSLYKYTSINEYSVMNLKNNSITATIPTEFNDLYDSTMHFDTYKQKLEQIRRLNETAGEIGYEEIIDYEAANQLLKGSAEEDIFKSTYLTKAFRITSLSSNNKDIKMWSHYANNNKGICIEYNFRQNFHRLADFIYPVIYMDKPIDVTEMFENDPKIDLAVLSSVVSKFKDWEHEKEWRIVLYIGYHSNEKRIPVQNLPIPSCIYLGNKFIDNYERCKEERSEESEKELLFINEFLQYVKRKSISLKKAKPQMRSYSLEFEDIDINDILNN